MTRLTLNRCFAGLVFLLGAQLLLPPFGLPSFSLAVSEFKGADSVAQFGTSAKAASSDVLSDIRDRGYLRVAVKDNRPPLGFTDEAGNLNGFEIEIARQLAANLLGEAEAIEFVPVSNVDRLSAVLAGEVDIAIAAITLTEPRRRLVNFSDPYYLDGTAFVVPAASSTAVVEDLRLAKIAVLDRSSTVPHLHYLLPGAQLVGVESYQAGQALLQNGEVDAFAGDASVLTGWVQPDGSLESGRLLPNVISVEPLAIALPKGQQYDTLKTEIDRLLRRWYAEEWLQAQMEYWGLPSGVLPSMLQRESSLNPLDE